MSFNITFNDGVDVTITDCLDVVVNYTSTTDIDFNNAVARNDDVVVFNIINDRLGGTLTA